MAKYNNQKAKILFLQQMLYESGENHTISMQMILDHLEKRGIKAERKSIYDDMDVLRYFGMDIRYRRERPSGYYLAGLTNEAVRMPEPVYNIPAIPPESAPEEEPVPAAAEVQGDSEESVQEDTVDSEPVSTDETVSQPDYDSWMKPGKGDRKKQMRLQCSEKGRKLAWDYFGDDADFKRRDDGFFIVSAPLHETPAFFGWITASGGEVKIIKPKKTAQAYREFLKTLIKDYK